MTTDMHSEDYQRGYDRGYDHANYMTAYVGEVGDNVPDGATFTLSGQALDDFLQGWSDGVDAYETEYQDDDSVHS